MEHTIRHLNVLEALGTPIVGEYIESEELVTKLSNTILNKTFTYNDTHNINSTYGELIEQINEKKNKLQNIIVQLLYYHDHERDDEQYALFLRAFDLCFGEYTDMVRLYDDYNQLFDTIRLFNLLK
jgi:hypothetical protein